MLLYTCAPCHAASGFDFVTIASAIRSPEVGVQLHRRGQCWRNIEPTLPNGGHTLALMSALLGMAPTYIGFVYFGRYLFGSRLRSRLVLVQRSTPTLGLNVLHE